MIRRLQLISVISFVVTIGAVAAFTQSRKERPPRALAVVDVLGNGRARLTPVAILIDGKFYDANLYRATPRPMSVDQDIIYDVLRAGKQVGTFTVGAVNQVSGVWVADGKIKEPKPERAPSEISASKNAPKRSSDDEDKPPVLRRPDSKSSSSPPGNTPTNSAPHADNPPASPTPPAKPAETSSSPDDEGRPTLKRGKPETKPESAPENSSKPKKNEAAAKSESATKVEAAAKTASKEEQGQVKETYTAISDVNTTEYRPFEYVMSADEQTRFPRDLTGMALEALNRFSTTHSTAGLPAPGPLQDVKLAVYDLDLNNTPTIIMTATKPAIARTAKAASQTLPALQFYVTVVARTDIYGNIRRLFTHVTDASHLDTIPRLELIDAADAEGTGRGQLLFRQTGEGNSRSFVLYRVGADQLWPLFEGGSHQ